MTTLDAPPAEHDAPRSALQKLRLAAADIKLAHSVFALPFAVLGAFMAEVARAGRVEWGAFAGKLGLIVVCMVAARTWAMVFNRVVDRKLDADNPRTSGRAFAAGRLSLRDGIALLGGSAGAFVAACALFGAFFANWAPLMASVPVLVWLAFYSLTKRFTALCHLVLGSALALSPIAAAVAVGGFGAIDPEQVGGLVLWLLAAMVLFWVAGFDVIYALADVQYDRSSGLRSIPAALGWKGAVWVSRVLHLVSAVALGMVGVMTPGFGVVFMLAIALFVLLLIVEHVVLAWRGAKGLQVAFFTVNGVISVVVSLLGVTNLLWSWADF